MFELISRYFWVIAVVICGIQHFQRMRAVEVDFASDPMMAQEARTLRRLYTLGALLPWLILGAGMVTGSVPTVWYIFRPQDGNPFVVAFLGVTLGMSLLVAFWILLADGARKVVEYRLMSFYVKGAAKPISPMIVKLLAGIGPFFTAFWIYMIIQLNIPIPK